ncbi:DUF742 domain-containing protein [Streptomyces rishiriensis]|uniref:DUF742 domain-containing protein n=1 Tax=Streptomyces rishiriensis TaxID=68264 RepID=UPI0037B097B9
MEAPGHGAWTSVNHGLRPYLLTGGRTRPVHELALESLLMTRPWRGNTPLGPDSERLLLLCSGAPLSVAELAARMGQPVQVTKILAADLVEAGALSPTTPQAGASTDLELLGAVLVGLRNRL